MFEVVSSIPAYTPKNFYDSIKIYNGKLYIFNYLTNAWFVSNNLDYTAEDVANKSTSTSLGTSDTLYPSQKAVKTYVDTAAVNRDLTTLTAGENITSGNVVCVKPSYSDHIASDDSYVYQGSAGTNYGTAETLKIGQDGTGNVYESYLKWDMSSLPSAELILKAELIVNERVHTGSSTSITVQRVTGADWAESTITYTNKPSTTNDIDTKLGMQKSYTSSGTGYHTLDITQLVRNWKSGNLNNYGIYMFGSGGASSAYDLDSSETTQGTQYKPVLRIYTTNTSDASAYKASCADYLLSRCVVGVAQESKNTSETLSVQHKGRCTNLALNSETAGNVYLSTAGAVVTSSNSLNRVIKLGKILSSNSCLLDIQDKGILIEKLYSPITATGTQRFYAPTDARFARVYFYITNSQSFYVDLYRDNDGLKTFNFGNYIIGTGQWWNFTWGANYIEIYNNQEITNIYFYT